MSFIALATMITISIVLLIHTIIKYIQQLMYLRDFASNYKTLPLPLLGHALQFYKVSPEELLPTIDTICKQDPQLRKAAGYIGHNRLLFVFHPETVEPVLNNSLHISKSVLYNMLMPWLSTGLLTSKGEKWRQRRKLMAHNFHFKILVRYLGNFNENIDILSQVLLREGKNGEEMIDLVPYISRCTLDVILESAMGKSLDIQNESSSDYFECIKDMLHIFQRRILSPWLWPEWVYCFTPTKKRQDKALKMLHDFTKKVIQERKRNINIESEEKKNYLSFVDLLLSTKTSDGQHLTDDDVQEEVDTFMFGGHDTTACALSWTLLLLANHPDIQDKIVEEQRLIFGDDADADVEQEHLGKMKYLECCIKESLRLYPTISLFARTSEAGLRIDGKVVPKGTTVVVAAAILHRNPKVWVEPDVFRPERFLAGSSEIIDRHPYSYIPFSAGPRSCIGQQFAMMEEKTVLSKLLRKVEVVKIDNVEDVKPLIEVVTRPSKGIRVYVKERKMVKI